MRKTLGNSGGKVVQAALFLTLGFIAAAACSRGEKVEVPPDAVVRLSDQFSGDFSLVDFNGEPVADEDFRGRTTVIYFGFATCPDVCPMALGTLSAALNELTARQRAKLAPIFITIDPERDTPEALKSYLAFDERIVGLTGTPEAAAAARQGFKVYAKKEPLPGSALDYTMNHSSLFYLVDPQGRPELALHDTLTAQQLAEMLRRTIRR